MATPQPVSDTQYREQIMQSSGPVLVEFWKRGCAPCTAFAPVLSQWATENPSVPVRTYEVDPSSPVRLPMWKRVRIAMTPTTILYMNGAPVMRLAGPRPIAQLRAEIAAALASPDVGRDVA